MFVLLGRKWVSENCSKSEGLKRTGRIREKGELKGPQHLYNIRCWKDLGIN